MVERLNGRGPYVHRDHGSEQRGVFSVPSRTMVRYQYEQSRQSKAETLEKIRALQRAKLEQSSGLGNKDLPAYRYKQEILDAVEANRAIILGGETGSGKSTQVPQYLYEAGYDKTYVLVPRRIIADGLGERIREELTLQLGEKVENTVGIVHGERVELHDENRIIVMTPDTFNGMLPDIEAQHEDKKVAIICDEIHEANLFTEIATGVAAIAVQEHPNWRLIAASATHNAGTLTEPFKKVNGGDNAEVPIVTIEGRPFNVELKEDSEHTPMEVYSLMKEKPDRTMIFTSGKREIEYIIDNTRASMEKNEAGSSSNIIFRKLHGELTEFELSHINDPVPDGYKLVIVSSPAGMSGITISGVTHVITDGTINRSELDSNGVSGLRRYYLSRAGIIQEIGRAGRDVAGGVGILAKPITIDEDASRGYYKEVDEPEMPFISFDDTKKRLDHEPAEIYHSNLGRVVLRLAGLDRRLSDVNEYIPHKVSPSAITSAEESLARLGALDDEYEITKIGSLMNRLPLRPELSRGVSEALLSDRPLQHLAQMAIIAAAVEQGGLQDFSNKSKQQRWQRLVRPTTTDDFIAQYDITMGIKESVEAHGPESERFAVHENDLHPKKMERAHKAARKILNVMNIRIDNLVLVMPRPDEEALLRRDFTAGMTDLVYEDVGTRNKKRYYQNIHGDIQSTERFISRSVAKPEPDALIAGFARWFEKRLPRGTIQHNDVVEQILKVNQEDIIHFAREHGTISTRPLPARLVGDKVLEQEQRIFGSIEVGKPVVNDREYIPEKTQKVIVQSALEHQGSAQRALRSVIEELNYYQSIIPPEELDQYKKKNAPEEVTAATIEALIREFAKETRSLSFLDRKIAHYVYSQGVGINRYYDDEARIQMQERSPKYIQIGDSDCQLYYENGQPYVAKISREQRPIADKGVYLPDGREVYLRVARKGSDLNLVPLRAITG